MRGGTPPPNLLSIRPDGEGGEESSIPLGRDNSPVLWPCVRQVRSRSQPNRVRPTPRAAGGVPTTDGSRRGLVPLTPDPRGREPVSGRSPTDRRSENLRIRWDRGVSFAIVDGEGRRLLVGCEPAAILTDARGHDSGV